MPLPRWSVACPTKGLGRTRNTAAPLNEDWDETECEQGGKTIMRTKPIQRMAYAGLCLTLALANPVRGATTAVAAATPEARVRCRIETERSVLPARTQENTILKITLEAADAPADVHQRTPVNLSIVLDRSGSMGGAKIEHARQAAIEAVRLLRPDDIVSLVTYDSQIETVIPPQRIRNIEWMEEQIRRIQPRGMTALFGGVSQGAAELRKHLDGRYTHRMILLSDGIANVGPSQPADLGRLGASLLKEGIQVSTVGIGLDYNDALMADLARSSGGNTHFVENSADLPRILAAELGEAQRLVARQAVVEIVLPEGVEPVRIIGRDGRISSRTVNVPLHHLQGGQTRYALVEVRVAPQAPRATLELARVRVSYDDPAANTRVTSGDQAVSVTFSEDTAAVTASANAEVHVEVLHNTLAVAQEEAIRLSDEGRAKDAAASLRGVAQAYNEMAERLNDDTLRRQAQDIDGDAARLESRGLDRRNRNAMRAKSYQTINQQKVR